jgi:hypothetical protein
MKGVWPALMVVALVVPTHRAYGLGRDSIATPTSRIWITGASNIRRFTCRASDAAGAIDLRARPTRDAIVSGDNLAASPSLLIQVATVDCGIGAMTEHLRETLRAGRFPTIEFRLAAYDVDLSARIPLARLTGFTTIHGVTRPVETMAHVRADSLGTLHVTGTYTLRMSDFGVRPPRRFGGLLRVHDRVTVHFDVAPQPTNALDELRCALIAHLPVEPLHGPTYALCL